MSDTEKQIKLLDWLLARRKDEGAFTVKFSDSAVATLTEIKGIVHKYSDWFDTFAVDNPYKDDDLVEKIENSLGQYLNLRGQYKGRDAFIAELRKLLSRQPEKLTVTEKEIFDFRDNLFTIGEDCSAEEDCEERELRYIAESLKCKGIKVVKK